MTSLLLQAQGQVYSTSFFAFNIILMIFRENIDIIFLFTFRGGKNDSMLPSGTQQSPSMLPNISAIRRPFLCQMGRKLPQFCANCYVSTVPFRYSTLWKMYYTIKNILHYGNALHYNALHYRECIILWKMYYTMGMHSCTQLNTQYTMEVHFFMGMHSCTRLNTQYTMGMHFSMGMHSCIQSNIDSF